MKLIYKWFMQQTVNGRILIAVAALFLVYFILIKLVYSPWQRQLSNLQQEVEGKIIDVAWMDEQLKKNRSLLQAAKRQTSETNSDGRSFISIIERSAKQNNIYSSVERISPDKVGRVKVWINDANFELWLKWIERLKLEGVDVVNVRVNQLSPTEKVTMTVTFQAAS